ncbi:hypothetical protein OG21DRAFT_1466832 [Imleria badia]|nr:hypothetical protein OG21DRAFT_1466832 [Imleria badia]
MEDLDLEPTCQCMEQALKRDNYQCIATGVYSLDPEHSPETPHYIGALQTAHILPNFTNAGIATSEDKKNEVCTVIQRYGMLSPPGQELNGDQVHHLENVMTLWNGIHSIFNELHMWFEPSDEDPYMCFVKTSKPNCLPALRDSFTMTTTDSDLPRPSPDYLRLHASCARIANLSGATRYVESLYSDLDDQDVLENNESSVMMALRNWRQYVNEYGQ